MTEISVAYVGDVSTVRMPRRVDVNNTQAFVDAVSQRSQGLVVLDFSCTESIDSTALGAIVQLYKLLRLEERDLRLAALSESVRRVFEITRLDRVFDIFQTTEEALAAGKQAS